MAAPSEAEIRAALLARCRAAEPGDLLVEEVPVVTADLSNRIDLAAAGAHLRGFEIKSAADNLSRLPAQALGYGLAFWDLTLVADASHLDHTSPLLGSHWGLVEVSRGPDGAVVFYIRREPAPNPDRDPSVLGTLLWKAEAEALAAAHGLVLPARARARDIHAALGAGVAISDIEAAVVAAWRSRGDWRDALRRTSARPTRPRSARSFEEVGRVASRRTAAAVRAPTGARFAGAGVPSSPMVASDCYSVATPPADPPHEMPGPPFRRTVALLHCSPTSQNDR